MYITDKVFNCNCKITKIPERILFWKFVEMPEGYTLSAKTFLKLTINRVLNFDAVYRQNPCTNNPRNLKSTSENNVN